MDRNQILTSFATSRQSRDAAEDVTQKVLALLHGKYAHVTELTTLVPLAFQVLRFKMLEAHRKSLRQGEYNQEPIEDHPLAPIGVTIRPSPLVDRLLSAVAQLGERRRHLFRLKLERNSFPEIQKIMDQWSINRIYTWDPRCRKQLLDSMGGRWD